MKKEEILKNIKNTYCRLRSSKVSGVGIIAIRNIPAKSDPFLGINNQKWYKFHISDFKNTDKEVTKMIDDFFGFEKNGETWVPEFGLNGMDISFFINHSKTPNIKTIDGGQNFRTLRKIKKGEELVIDYANYNWEYK